MMNVRVSFARLNDGDTCEDDKNCGNGSYCKSSKDSDTKTCAKYLAPGAECDTTEDPMQSILLDIHVLKLELAQRKLVFNIIH